MLCDVVWTGSFQSRITTSGGRTANATRRTHAEKVKCPKSATAHSAHTHTAEIVAFMYFGCMMQLYRLCAPFDVLKCTPPRLDEAYADERTRGAKALVRQAASHHWKVTTRFGSRNVFDILACKRRLWISPHIVVELREVTVRWPLNVGLLAGVLLLSTNAGTLSQPAHVVLVPTSLYAEHLPGVRQASLRACQNPLLCRRAAAHPLIR